ncbi:hypothetical protein STEG23_036907 [Scotinomys teguina]
MQVRHVTGLPYNPQGQGIVERENRSLKELLQKTPPSSADIPLRGQRPSSGTPEKSPRPHQYVSLLESCPSYTLGPRSTRTPSHRKAKMGRRQCKSAYNIIKNKTTPESSPPPTPKSDYCNTDKAEENDLKKSLMKMLEEAFEEK